MKLKGVNPIEQHIEKLVLGLVGLVFVGVLAMQFLISPNEIEYDGQKVPPDKVLDRLGDRASSLYGQMIDPEPRLPEIGTPDLAGRFDEEFGKPIIEATRIAAAPFGERFELAIAEVENLDAPVTPLELPAPGLALVAQQWSTVDPFFLAATPSMAKYLPSEQPLDKVTVSIESVINGEQIRRALEKSVEGYRSIPRHWWSDGGRGLVEILSVELERQELLADGSWSDAVAVEQVRWTPSVLDMYNEGASDEDIVTWDSLRPSDLRVLAGMAQDDPALVSQPGFLPTIAGVEWVAPSKVEKMEARLEIEASIERLESEIEELEEDIARIKDRQQGRKNNPSSSRPDPRGSGVMVISGSGGSRSGSRARTQRDDPLEKQIKAKQSQISDKEEELDELYAKLDEDDSKGASSPARRPSRSARSGPASTGGGGGVIIIGGSDPYSSRGSGRSSSRSSVRSGAGSKAGPESPGPLLDVESYQVWSHDLTAEPGARYRYRLRYGVNNPLFGRERSLGSDDPEILSRAGEPLVFSPWTPWSEQVNVGRKDYFFVTSAREEGQLNQRSASATAEVYRVVYGYYRKHTVTLEPGDALEGKFSLPEDLPRFVNIDDIDADDLDAYFAEREQGAGADLDAPEEVAERPWLEFMAPEQSLPLDAVMLDVAEYPLMTESSPVGEHPRRLFEVFFFDPKSGVVSRRPDRDRGMVEYSMVERSARLSESAEIRRPDPEYVP